MKTKIFITVLISAFIISCGGNENTKLELFSPEAFAYNMDDIGWEITASVLVKGFQQTEVENTYSAKLSYTIDLITPSGVVLEDVADGLIDETAEEEMLDLTLDTQLMLDASYKSGEYKVVFYVTDDLTGKEVSLTHAFSVSAD